MNCDEYVEGCLEANTAMVNDLIRDLRAEGATPAALERVRAGVESAMRAFYANQYPMAERDALLDVGMVQMQ